jgi:hypothetical protein
VKPGAAQAVNADYYYVFDAPWVPILRLTCGKRSAKRDCKYSFHSTQKQWFFTSSQNNFKDLFPAKLQEKLTSSKFFSPASWKFKLLFLLLRHLVSNALVKHLHLKIKKRVSTACAHLRPCPICGSSQGEVLHTQKFLMPQGYSLPADSIYEDKKITGRGGLNSEKDLKPKCNIKAFIDNDTNKVTDNQVNTCGNYMLCPICAGNRSANKINQQQSENSQTLSE